MADKIVSWGGFDSKGTSGMGVTGSISVVGSGSFGYGSIANGNTYIKIDPNQYNSRITFNDFDGGISTRGGELEMSTYFSRLTYGSYNWFYIGNTQYRYLFYIGDNRRILISDSSTKPTNTDAMLTIKGTGTTSSTTSFLVQDSNGSSTFEVKDDRSVTIYGPLSLSRANQGYIYYTANDYIAFPRQGGAAPGYFNTSTEGDGWAFRIATNNQTYARIMEGSFYLEAYTPNSNGRNSIKTWFSGSNFVYIDGDGVTGNSPSYGNGVNIIIRGGKSGTYSNVDNRGAAGYVTVEGGSAFSSSFTTHVPAAGVNIQTGLGLGTGSAADLTFSTSTTSSVASTYHTQTQRMIIKGQTGFVGIGTSNPNYTLDVSGSSEFIGSMLITGSVIISGSASTGEGSYNTVPSTLYVKNSIAVFTDLDNTASISLKGSSTNRGLKGIYFYHNGRSAWIESAPAGGGDLGGLRFGAGGNTVLDFGVYGYTAGFVVPVTAPSYGGSGVNSGTHYYNFNSSELAVRIASTRLGSSGRGNLKFQLATGGGDAADSDTFFYVPGTNKNISINSATTDLGATLGIKGSGTTSSTTALLVQNANATASLSVTDNRIVTANSKLYAGTFTPGANIAANHTIITDGAIFAGGGINVYPSVGVGHNPFTGWTSDGGPLYATVNGGGVLNMNYVGGGNSGASLVISNGYNPGASTGTVYGVTHHPTFYPTADTSIDYISYSAQPGWNSTPYSSRLVGKVRGFYFGNGLYTSQSLIDVRAIDTDGGKIRFNGLVQNAVSGSAYGVSITHTISASANSDTLTGVYIQPTFANGAYTGVTNYALRVSGSTYLYKSGSTVLDVQGSSGQLFSVTDSLSGSLFSVNTVAGLPVIEAFSNNNVNIGKYGTNAIFVSGSGNVGIGTSTPTVRLDISGSARFTNSAVVTGSVTIKGPSGGSGGISILGEPYTGTGQPFTGSYETQLVFSTGYNPSPSAYVYPNFQISLGGSTAYYTANAISISQGSSGVNMLSLTGGGRNFSFYPYEQYIYSSTNLNLMPVGSTGIGTTSPSARLTVQGSGTTSSTTSLLVQNANATASFSVKDGLGQYNTSRLQTIAGDWTDSAYYTHVLWRTATLASARDIIIGSDGTLNGYSSRLNFVNYYSNGGQGNQSNYAGYIRTSISQYRPGGTGQYSGRGTLLLGVYDTDYDTIALDSFDVVSVGKYTTSISGSLAVTGSVIISGSDITTAWTSYTPSWTSDGTAPTLGNGSLTGAYKVIGKTCFVRVRLYWGSTTVNGTGVYYFSLPVSASVSWGVQMPASILDNGNAWYQATANGEYGGYTDRVALIGQSSGANSSQGVAYNFPIAFGNLDSIQFAGSYEIA